MADVVGGPFAILARGHCSTGLVRRLGALGLHPAPQQVTYLQALDFLQATMTDTWWEKVGHPGQAGYGYYWSWGSDPKKSHGNSATFPDVEDAIEFAVRTCERTASARSGVRTLGGSSRGAGCTE